MQTPRIEIVPAIATADGGPPVAAVVPSRSGAATVLGLRVTGRQGGDQPPPGGAPAGPAVAITGTLKSRRRQRRRAEALAVTDP